MWIHFKQRVCVGFVTVARSLQCLQVEEVKIGRSQTSHWGISSKESSKDLMCYQSYKIPQLLGQGVAFGNIPHPLGFLTLKPVGKE